MAEKNLNNRMLDAKNAKNDEFYTQITDIENNIKSMAALI